MRKFLALATPLRAAAAPASDAMLQTSSGNEALDDAALKCVVTWRYRPAMDNGVPVPMAWHATVGWRMH